MTRSEFEKWWFSRAADRAPEKSQAWRAFLREFEEQIGGSCSTIHDVPEQHLESFMAAHTLIFS